MRRATSTPTPSLGKNVSGGRSRHLPSAIQVVSTSRPPSIVPHKISHFVGKYGEWVFRGASSRTFSTSTPALWFPQLLTERNSVFWGSHSSCLNDCRSRYDCGKDCTR